MDGLTPLVCFLIGVAVSGIGLGLLAFFLMRSVAEHRKRFPGGFEDVRGGGRFEESKAALHQRIQQLEKRLAEIEEQIAVK